MNAAQLIDAATSGDVKAIQQLSNQPGFLVDVRDPVGFTPLLLAVKNGNFHAAELLLQLRASVDDNDNEARSPSNLFYFLFFFTNYPTIRCRRRTCTNPNPNPNWTGLYDSDAGGVHVR